MPIHISDYSYPREIIKEAFCPFCNYLGPLANRGGHETNEYGEFAVDNFLFHCGEPRGDERRSMMRIHSKRVNGFFALVFDKKHKNYKKATVFMEERVGFNGNPNDVEYMVPDCYRYRCRRIGRRKYRSKIFGDEIKVDYCRKYKKDIWDIRRTLRHNCGFLQPGRCNRS